MTTGVASVVGRSTMSRQPPLITDAAPSFDEEQARRRRTYVVIMFVHLVGFAVSYPLYLWQPWAGAVMVRGHLDCSMVALLQPDWSRATMLQSDRRPEADGTDAPRVRPGAPSLRRRRRSTPPRRTWSG